MPPEHRHIWKQLSVGSRIQNPCGLSVAFFEVYGCDCGMRRTDWFSMTLSNGMHLRGEKKLEEHLFQESTDAP